MSRRGQAVSIIAGRVGLYHFLALCSAILLDTGLFPRTCRTSPIGAVAQLVESPGTFADQWQWPSVVDPTLQAVIAVCHVVWIVCVSSTFYACLTALVLHTVRRLRL